MRNMYEASLGHSLYLEDIQKGIRLLPPGKTKGARLLTLGKTKRRITRAEIRENSFRVYMEGKIHGKRTTRTIYFNKDGRIQSKRRHDVQLGIKLLKEVGIVLINPEHSTYKV